MKGRISDKMSEVQVDPNVIALYAGAIAVGRPDIVGIMAISMKNGLAKLLRRESLTHGINVAINNNRISFDSHVIVSYGVNISTISDNLVESMKYRAKELIGMEVEKINVLVEGVKVVDQEEAACGYKYN